MSKINPDHPAAQTVEPRRLLSNKEAAEYTGMSEHQLNRARWAKPSKIGYYLVGNVVKYSIEQLDAYLESCRIDATR